MTFFFHIHDHQSIRWRFYPPLRVSACAALHPPPNPPPLSDSPSRAVCPVVAAAEAVSSAAQTRSISALAPAALLVPLPPFVILRPANPPPFVPLSRSVSTALCSLSPLFLGRPFFSRNQLRTPLDRPLFSCTLVTRPPLVLLRPCIVAADPSAALCVLLPLHIGRPSFFRSPPSLDRPLFYCAHLRPFFVAASCSLALSPFGRPLFPCVPPPRPRFVPFVSLRPSPRPSLFPCTLVLDRPLFPALVSLRSLAPLCLSRHLFLVPLTPKLLNQTQCWRFYLLNRNVMG